MTTSHREQVVERGRLSVAARGGATGWNLLLAVAVAVQTAALTAWPRVVTVDGPAHLAGAAALLRAGDPSYDVYQVDLGPVPNLLTTLLLAALLTVLGPDGAERLLVLGYAIGLPLALRYALRGVHPQAGWLALVAVPFVGGYMFAYGFYNLSLALIGMLVVAGLALRQQSGWSARAATVAAGLLLLTWSAHLLPVLVAGVLLAVLAGCRIAADRHRGLLRALRAHLAPVVLLGLPVLALTLTFAGASAGARGEPVRASSPGMLLLGLLDLGRPLVVWTTWEYAGSILVALGLAGIAVRGRRQPRSPERTALAISGVLMTVWYLLSPDRYGPAYGFLNDRLSLFPPLLLALWAAAPPPTRRAGRAAVALVLVGSAALVGLRLPTDVRYQRDVGELVSIADQVPRGSSLVLLRLVRDAPVGPDARNRTRDPLRHAGGRVAVLRDAVDVGHYEAVTPYFPVRFAPGTDPRRAIDPDLTGLDQVPPRIDLAAGPRVVLLVGRTRAPAEVLAAPESVRLLADLETRYELVATSERSALVEVWRRR